jgi:hypothetical protein
MSTWKSSPHPLALSALGKCSVPQSHATEMALIVQMDQEAEAEAVATTDTSMQVSPLLRDAPKTPKQHTMPSFLSQPTTDASPSTLASRRWKRQVRAAKIPKQQSMSGFLSQPTPSSIAVSPPSTRVSPGGTAAQPRRVLLPSGLSASQIECLQRLAAVADGVKLASDFTSDVTHVVTNDDRGVIMVRSLQSPRCAHSASSRHVRIRHATSAARLEACAKGLSAGAHTVRSWPP